MDALSHYQRKSEHTKYKKNVKSFVYLSKQLIFVFNSKKLRNETYRGEWFYKN